MVIHISFNGKDYNFYFCTGSSGCSSCAQLRSLGLGGAAGGLSTYKHSRSYNLPDNATLATNRALNSMDNLQMHDRMQDGCPSSPTAVPVFMCNDKDRGTTHTQVVYPHIHQSKDDLKDRPSWRCLAVGFLVFALLLFGVIAFLTVLVMTRAPVSMESFNPSKSSNSESDIGEPGAPVTALGDAGRLPSHSRFDFVQSYTLNGHRSKRDSEEESPEQRFVERRDLRSSTGGHRVWTFTEEFVAGEWFLGIFNDGGNDEDIQIVSTDNGKALIEW
ncbi:putative teneurin-3 isoform X2 [Apostichopus japonicus]|uniref:Putative teneurin-3 isoform X2 n=1 Tax=Stichopus japonicus TaxID=307972 RepID=A0A2G8KFI8_STIJA|nr:putative teneurin-3 isoform X2 [Apostichopus japonicus]